HRGARPLLAAPRDGLTLSTRRRPPRPPPRQAVAGAELPRRRQPAAAYRRRPRAVARGRRAGDRPGTWGAHPAPGRPGGRAGPRRAGPAARRAPPPAVRGSLACPRDRG